ncbi:MAG: redoxin family protein [Lentisphaeraceae bacterium]|nr:redoxin family protein [Lentisphaeraceae bacterium]
MKKSAWTIFLLCSALLVMTATAGHKAAKKLNRVLVDAEGKKLKVELDSKKYLVFYYSASWCPPCQKFTPSLVKFYDDNKELHDKFELIFVSSDKNEESQLAYMKKKHMSFPAVKFSKIRKSGAKDFMGGRGIPHLSMVDAKGKTVVNEVAWTALPKIKELLKK